MAHCRLIVSDHFTSAAGTGEAGGAIAHPDFGNFQLILSQLGCTDYAHYTRTCPQVPSSAPAAIPPPRSDRSSYSPALRDEGIIIILLSRLDF